MTGRLASRRGVVLLLLLAGGLLVLAAGRTWTIAVVPDVPGTPAVSVSGREAAPGAVAAALVVLAAAVSLTIAGRVALRVAGVLLLVGGAAVTAASVAALRDPRAVLAGPAAAASGITDATLSAVDVTAWPVLSAAGGVVVVLGASAVLGLAGRWTPPRRFGRADVVPPGEGPRGTAPAPPTSERDRAMDDWDALSRGDDPTS